MKGHSETHFENENMFLEKWEVINTLKTIKVWPHPAWLNCCPVKIVREVIGVAFSSSKIAHAGVKGALLDHPLWLSLMIPS